MNKHRGTAAFAAGLLVVAWVATGYLRSNLPALAMTLVIGAFYLAGARELQRLRQATTGFVQALGTAPAADAPIDAWTQQLPSPWQHLVRARLEGERTVLPAPSMAPYLAGLLVLLGMLGTFLGMVVTLNGTGAALQRAADLAAMRESLAAPVQGLGLAFGTSVAGVAASAMLGLMSAWTRRDVIEASQRLDTLLATTLRGHTLAHRRELAFRLQQAQAVSLPALVERMQALGEQLAEQERQRSAQAQADQARLQAGTEAAYRELARSVEHALQRSLADSARAAADAVRPVVEATMGQLAEQSTSLQHTVDEAVQRQLDSMGRRVDGAVERVSAAWQASLAEQVQAQQAQAAHWREALDGVQRDVAQRSAAWLDQAGHAQAGWRQALADTTTALAREAAGLHEGVATQASRHLAEVAAQLQATQDAQAARWQAQHERQAMEADRRAAQAQQAWAEAAGSFGEQASALVQAVQTSHTTLQAELAARDDERRQAWIAALQAMTVSMQRAWAEAGEHATRQQARIGQALEQTAQAVAAEAQRHAQATVAEVERLVQVAAEAPRAAAEAIGHVRAQLAASEAQDRAMLAERERLMGTLARLLDGLDEASGRQRQAVEQLVQTSHGLLADAAERFGTQVQAAGAHLGDVAAQLTGSAVEVASLGEAFGVAVQQFTQSGDRMIGHLRQLDDTLGRSLERSDEQLAYYVAQARELIDLSLMSQKQVVDDLQRIAAARLPEASAA